MKKIIATLLLAAAMLSLAVVAFAAPASSATPVPGTAPAVLTADMLYVGVNSAGVTEPEWAPHQLRKSWHGYSIAKSADGVVFGAPTNDNTNFEITYVLSQPNRTEEAFANKYYPTMSTVDQPVFGIKFKVNAAAKTQFDKDENGGYLRLEFNTKWHGTGKNVKLKTAAADEWTIVTYDVTGDQAFGSSLGNLNDITCFSYKPLGDTGALAEGAELTVAWMGFFADANAAKNYGQGGGTPGNPGTADATSIAVLAAVAALGTGIVISKKRR